MILTTFVMMNKSTLVEKLRAIDRDAWAKVEHPNGWTYHANIGQLIHEAADRIEALEKITEGRCQNLTI